MSLFRNIPLSEAVDVVINLIFGNRSDITFTKRELQKKHEQTWIEEATNVKPIFHKRYVDETFAVFESDADAFHSYLNTRHENIKFTFEKNKNKEISLFRYEYIQTIMRLICKF